MSNNADYLKRIGVVILPAIVFASALLLNLTTIPVTASLKISIPFILMVSYYWSIYEPHVAKLWIVFLCGLMLDLITGVPLGLNAFSLVAMCWVARDQRVVLITQPFFILWGLFALFCCADAFIKWFLFGLVAFQWGDLSMLLPDVLAGIVIYPFIAIILHVAGKIALGDRSYSGGGVHG